MSALARTQAAGLRSAAAACNPSRAALKARLATAADSLEGLATVVESAHRRASDVAARLTQCANDLNAGVEL